MLIKVRGSHEYCRISELEGPVLFTSELRGRRAIEQASRQLAQANSSNKQVAYSPRFVLHSNGVS